MRTGLLAALLGTIIVCVAPAVAASPTTFTYQGHLAQGGNPAEGAYEFEIRLLDNLGAQIGLTQTASEIVTAGAFTMELDFGNASFDGSERYLEISVRSVADGGAYVVLSPNQLVTSTPVAQFALEGNEGPVGPQGSPGNDGADGAPGSQGPQGNPGADGSDGAPGAQGIQGEQGPQGLQGIQGNTGPTGPQGNPGDSHWTLNGTATYYNAGIVGIGTSNPTAQLHIAAEAGEEALRVQQGGVTRLRVNALGGVALGVNNSFVEGGNTFVSGKLGVGLALPTDRVSVSVSSDTIDGVQVSNGLTNVRLAPARLRFAQNGELKAAGQLNINADNSAVVIEGAIFSSNDVTIIDDLNVNNDIIASSQLTVGGAEAFDFTINCYGTAGKPGGGSWSVFSDERLKMNITSMTGSLDTISALRPVNFEYKSEDHFSYLPGVQRGFIAQEVQKVIPQWVNTADDGYFYLDQIGYEALIVDAIQELRTEKDKQIEQLQSENELLKARLDRLERMMTLSIDR